MATPADDAALERADCVVVLCTFPTAAVAAAVGRELVEAGTCACVNVVPTIRSIYRWENEICDETEALAVIKTTAAGFEALRAQLVRAHPYDCPEVIALPILAGHQPYLDWVASACGGAL